MARHSVQRRARFGALAMLTLAVFCAAVPAVMLLQHAPTGAMAMALPIAILVASSFLFLAGQDQVDDELAAGLRAAHAACALAAAGLRLSKSIFAALGAVGAAPAPALARSMLPPAPAAGPRAICDLNLTPRLLGQRPLTPASIAGQG